MLNMQTCFKIAAAAICTIVVVNLVSAAHVVRTGSIAEGRYGVKTAETLTREGCGSLINLFANGWTPEKVREIGEYCRKHGCIFTMDEMFDRITGDWKQAYKCDKDEFLSILHEYADVCKGTQHYS